MYILCCKYIQCTYSDAGRLQGLLVSHCVLSSNMTLCMQVTYCFLHWNTTCVGISLFEKEILQRHLKHAILSTLFLGVNPLNSMGLASE